MGEALSARGQRICVAQIGTAHGVRGEVRLKSFTADPMAVANYGALASEDGTRSFEIVALRPAKEVLVARLKGVNDRTAAEALTNLRLFVPRERLPAIDDDEAYYHADLVGLAVTEAAGARLGTVIAVQNFGAGDVLEVEPAGGGPSVLVPFTTAAVPVVDMDAGRLVIADPDAWFAPSPAPDAAEPVPGSRPRGRANREG